MVTFITIVTIALCVYVIAVTQPSAVQIHTQYSAVGEAHYYKSQWYYLYAFAGFSLLVGVINILCTLRLYANQRRDFALGLGWISVLVLVITFAYTYNVMQLAHI
jgi:hypothetical protein